MAENNVIPIGGELVTLTELKARDRARRAAFYEAHREVIDAARPSWAQRTVIDAVDDAGADLVYLTEFDALELTRPAQFVDGSVRYTNDTDLPSANIYTSVEDMTVAEMRRIASSLLAAIPTAEAAGVTP